jgi:ADP-heptose:LPS heptosyltransferase
MGDVAMTVPVLKQVLEQNPDTRLTVVSSSYLAPFFSGIDRLSFYPVEFNGKHKGIKGLLGLFRDLIKDKTITGVADLHSVLRTQLLSVLFKLSGYKLATIDKGRSEKKQLVRHQPKKLEPLKSTFYRYAKVFSSLGLAVELQEPVFISKSHLAIKKIGIAPFAQYEEKMYPLAQMEKVIELLSRQQGVEVLLFGGKGEEAGQLDIIASKYSGVTNMAGKFSLQKELIEISELNIMVSMDSANMHLASNKEVPVISIWGATHPYAGFKGWGQSLDNCVQADLACRPCSVFGNKKCHRGDLACMNLISPQEIVDKVNQVLA